MVKGAEGAHGRRGQAPRCDMAEPPVILALGVPVGRIGAFDRR